MKIEKKGIERTETNNIIHPDKTRSIKAMSQSGIFIVFLVLQANIDIPIERNAYPRLFSSYVSAVGGAELNAGWNFVALN